LIFQPILHHVRFGMPNGESSMVGQPALNTCEDPLQKKIQEGLVGVDALEMGGPLVLKHMLDINMDVNDSALRAYTQSLQTLWLMDFPGTNVCTAVSFLNAPSYCSRIIMSCRQTLWLYLMIRWDWPIAMILVGS